MPGTSSYGIVDAKWVETETDRDRNLQLITGGLDGCIRIWDVMRSTDDPSNGRVIARMDSDIGCFSVGDKTNGEKTLVVGDCGNCVSIFGRDREFPDLR